MTRKQIIIRLEELEADRRDCREAIKNILTGKAQSYGIGTRNVSRYGMTLSELRAHLTEIEKRIAELEAALATKTGGRRFGYEFVPRG